MNPKFSGRGMLVNRQRCCDIFGWTLKVFNQHLKAGMPVESVPDTRGGDYQVYTGDVVQWLFKQARASAAGNGSGEIRSFEEERTRLAAEQADNYALKNAQARGELMPAADVVAGWQAAVGRCRAMFLGMASALAPRYVALA